MENSINIAKFLQKLFWGFLFSVLSILIILYIKEIEIGKLFTLIKSFSGFVQGLSLVIVIGLVAIIGIKIQDLLILLIQNVLSFIYRINLIKTIINKFKLDNIFKSEAQIAKELFIDLSDDILKWLYLKSWAQPEVLGSVTGIDIHCNNVKEHILNLKNNELIVQFDYYSSITQEKAVKDQLRNSIKDQYYILINSFLTIIFLLTVFHTVISIIAFIFIYLLLLVFILREVSKIKLQLAFYIINGYVDCFSLGQGATIADRETNIL